MNKSYEYATKVIAGKIVAPKQIKKQCENFVLEFDKLQHEPEHIFFWNEETEAEVNTILSNLNFSRGAKGGQNIADNLALWQYFFIQNIFCWQYKPTDKIALGKRRYREGLLTVARKNAKSVNSALIHLIAFFLDEDNATHYLGSNTKKQASIIFEELIGIIKKSPMAMPAFKILKGHLEFKLKDGKLEKLSGDAQRADGTMSYVASVDECGADNNIRKMISSIETGQLGPRNPLIIKISSAYGIENGFNYWEGLCKEATDNTYKFGQEGHNVRQFALIYVIDEADEAWNTGEFDENGKEIILERWENPAVWPESNPLVAEVEDLAEKLMEDYNVKKNIPLDFHDFKIKNLNIFLQNESGTGDKYFSDLKTIRKAVFQPAEDWNWWRGKQKIMVGIDLSLLRDNTSISYLWHDVDGEEGRAGITYVKNIVYYPANEEARKIKSEGLHYDTFSKFGWSKPIGEETIDLMKLGKEIVEVVNEYQLGIGTIIYDNKYSKTLLPYLNDNIRWHLAPTELEQNPLTMGPVIALMNKALYDGDLRHAPNELYEAAFTNGLFEFPKGRAYIRKSNKDRNKIDSLFSTLNAFKGVLIFQDLNYYEDVKPFSWNDE